MANDPPGTLPPPDDASNPMRLFVASLTARDVARLADAAEHDRRVADDAEAQRIADHVASEVRALVAYMLADADVASLERLAERLGTVGMGEALRLARARRGG